MIETPGLLDPKRRPKGSCVLQAFPIPNQSPLARSRRSGCFFACATDSTYLGYVEGSAAFLPPRLRARTGEAPSLTRASRALPR